MRIAALGSFPRRAGFSRGTGGLGVVTRGQADAALTVLGGLLDRLDVLREALDRAEISGYAGALIQQWRQIVSNLEARYEALLGRYDELEPEGFDRWLEDANLLQQELEQTTSKLKQVLLDERAPKNFKVAFATVGAVGLVVGGLYLLSRMRR